MKLNDQKITKEFCRGKVLIFLPKTADEANFINQKRNEFGFDKPGTKLNNPAECVARGLAFTDTVLQYFDPQKHIDGIVCSVDQFGENYLSPQMAFMMEQFNKLSAKVDAIYEELRPAKLDKPMLKKPGDAAP